MEEDFSAKPYTLQKFLVVPLNKPIYGTSNYAIREKYIEIAKNYHKALLIRTPNGQEIIDPAVYKKEATKIEKEFKIPGCPMILYQRTLKLTPLQPIEKYQFTW
jgi:hypothetical protein